MDHPLLLDMAVHAFDAARWFLGADPVGVYCEEFNPELELVPGRGRGVGDVRDDDRRAVRLHRKLVQPRPRDLVERHVRVADVLAAAHEEACRRAVGPVRDRLRSWTTLPPAAA